MKTINALLLLLVSSFCYGQSLFFTNLTSGPNSGGESVSGYAGAYVTIYGNGFGSSQNSSTVTLNSSNCLRVVSWGTAWRWYQKIVVQLGPSCTTGNFVVATPSGASNALPFTVRSGHLYFVSTSGSDSANGSAATPWKTPLHALGAVAAGDTVYLQNGVSQTSDDGTGWRTSFGIRKSGSAGSPIAFVAYPGAVATIGSTSGPNFGVRFEGSFDYWVFAGLVLRGEAVGIRTTGNYSWVIGNDISCNSPADEESGCLNATEGSNTFHLGNYLHDVGNPQGTKLEHADYISTDNNHDWVAWNEIANNASCHGIQFHSSPIGSGSGNNMFDIHVHDNLIYGQACAGINFATVDPSQGGVEAYNNVLYHNGTGGTDGSIAACIYAPGYVNAGSAGSGNVEIYNNTLYDCGVASGLTRAGILALAGSNGSVKYRLRNNIIYAASSGEPYLAGDSGQFACLGGDNDFFNNSGVPSACGSGNLNVNPLLVAVASADFHLQTGSPMIGTGTTSLFPTTDIAGTISPSPPSIGAYELAGASAVSRPNPPTNLAVTVK